MSSLTERKISTLNSAEGICEDVIEFENKNKDGDVTYKGQRLILKTENQYFSIEAKADLDMPKIDEVVLVHWYCNGRRWRKAESDDWKYFTSLKLRGWESVSVSPVPESDDAPF